MENPLIISPYIPGQTVFWRVPFLDIEIQLVGLMIDQELAGML